MALMTLFTLAQYAPMMAQSNDQAGKTAKKDKLEQRSQNKSDQSNDHTGADRFGRRGDRKTFPWWRLQGTSEL